MDGDRNPLPANVPPVVLEQNAPFKQKVSPLAELPHETSLPTPMLSPEKLAERAKTRISFSEPESLSDGDGESDDPSTGVSAQHSFSEFGLTQPHADTGDATGIAEDVAEGADGSAIKKVDMETATDPFLPTQQYDWEAERRKDLGFFDDGTLTYFWFATSFPFFPSHLFAFSSFHFSQVSPHRLSLK